MGDISNDFTFYHIDVGGRRTYYVKEIHICSVIEDLRLSNKEFNIFFNGSVKDEWEPYTEKYTIPNMNIVSHMMRFILERHGKPKKCTVSDLEYRVQEVLSIMFKDISIFKMLVSDIVENQCIFMDWFLYSLTRYREGHHPWVIMEINGSMETVFVSNQNSLENITESIVENEAFSPQYELVTSGNMTVEINAKDSYFNLITCISEDSQKIVLERMYEDFIDLWTEHKNYRVAIVESLGRNVVIAKTPETYIKILYSFGFGENSSECIIEKYLLSETYNEDSRKWLHTD